MPNSPNWSDIRKRVTPSFVFIAPLVLMILLAGYLRFTYEPDPIFFEIDMPDRVSADENGVMNLSATFRLTNNMEEFAQLSAESQCHVMRWYIVDRAEQIIQSARQPTCGPEAVYETIEPGSALVFSTGIALDPARILEGERYDLRVRFWDQEAEARFRVTD